ncbi:MAG: FecR domain-containing protein [Planctomycetes bacterium]|nr:FecR domain-containing protein [Planctomycetota bacterium]
MKDKDNETESNHDYLWDGRGEPDEIIASLERRLAPLRYRSRRSVLRGIFGVRAAAVAAAAILMMIPFFLFNTPDAPATAYEVTLLAGIGRVQPPGGREPVLLTPENIYQFPVGAKLACDAGARARVRMIRSNSNMELGEASLDGPCDVDLVQSSPTLEKLYLHRGSLSARVSANAKPRLFQVGTPSGTAVDLGCIYTVRVRDDGAAELHVSIGRVAFEIHKNNLVIWSGASCVADTAGNITTPVDDDAPAGFREALARHDARKDGNALEDLLNTATVRQSASLWHLLQSAGDAERGSIYDKLAALAPPPAGVTRERALALDRDALEAWRLDIMHW